MVGRLTLDQLVQVRVLFPQPMYSKSFNDLMAQTGAFSRAPNLIFYLLPYTFKGHDISFNFKL